MFLGLVGGVGIEIGVGIGIGESEWCFDCGGCDTGCDIGSD